MWIITHIPSGASITGLNDCKGFYSYKDAHKFILKMNKTLKLGCYLYHEQYCSTLKDTFITNLYPLQDRWSYRRIHRTARVYKLAETFENVTLPLYLKNIMPFLGLQIIDLLIRKKIRQPLEQLFPINKKEFLIHYIN